MHEAVIVSTARTPIATAFKGSLVDVDPFDLATHVVAQSVRRAGIEPLLIDDVVMGESLYGGGDIARYSAIEAGLVHAPGVAHNRHCASSLAAVQSAAASIRAGMDRAVVAGGAYSQSTSPRSTRRVPGTDDWTDWMSPSHRDTPDAPNMDMSITVGWNAAVSAGVTREEMDAWALRSHQRAVAAIDAGSFEDEIAPLEVTRRDGRVTTFAVDEHPRRETSMEKLASLKPLHPEIEGFSITAGNAAGVNDGAAAMVIVDQALVEELGLSSAGRRQGLGFRRGPTRTTPVWPRPSPSPRPWTAPASRWTTWTCGRSTRPSPPCAWPPPASSGSTRPSSTSSAAAAVSATPSP